MTRTEIFISSSGNNSENIVNQLNTSANEHRIALIHDTRNPSFSNLIADFIAPTDASRAIAVILNENYLKSPYCLCELIEIQKSNPPADRIFYLIPDTAFLSAAVNTLRQYHELKKSELDATTAVLGAEAAAAIGDNRALIRLFEHFDLLISAIENLAEAENSIFTASQSADYIRTVIESVGYQKVVPETVPEVIPEIIPEPVPRAVPEQPKTSRPEPRAVPAAQPQPSAPVEAVPQVRQQKQNNAFDDCILVKGGRFLMGSPEKEGEEIPYDEQPQHQVIVSSFYMQKHPVTIGDYLAFARATNSCWPEWLVAESTYYIHDDSEDKNYYPEAGTSDKNTAHPITGISWEDTQSYAAWLSQKTGVPWRLPTEAEWEYAARGGNHAGQAPAQRWAGTNKEAELKDYAWYTENSNNKTHPVAQKKPNLLGLYDMSGNVQEYCSDWYSESYYEECHDKGTTENPCGPEEGEYRVCRGGDWDGDSQDCSVTYRQSADIDEHDYYLGFRLVCSAE